MHLDKSNSRYCANIMEKYVYGSGFEPCYSFSKVFQVICISVYINSKYIAKLFVSIAQLNSGSRYNVQYLLSLDARRDT